MLPLRFLPAAGRQHRLVHRPLPLKLAPVLVAMIWHLRRDGDPAHRWLRARIEEAATTTAGER